MKNPLQSSRSAAGYRGASGLVLAVLLTLTACGTPLQAARPAVYDFGPGPLSTLTAPAPANQAWSRPLIIGPIEATAALDSTAVQYRLAYTDAQQLKPYTKARWSMAPAELIRQRLRQQLSQRHTLLNPGEGGLPGVGAPNTLRVELEEFSQLFQAPATSTGLLRLRATLTLTQANGATRVAQRSVIVQRPAPSPDAAGGVRALTAAADAAVQEIDEWLGRLVATAR